MNQLGHGTAKKKPFKSFPSFDGTPLISSITRSLTSFAKSLLRWHSCIYNVAVLTHRWPATRIRLTYRTPDSSMSACARSSAGTATHRNTAGASRWTPGTASSCASCQVDRRAIPSAWWWRCRSRRPRLASLGLTGNRIMVALLDFFFCLRNAEMRWVDAADCFTKLHV